MRFDVFRFSHTQCSRVVCSLLSWSSFVRRVLLCLLRFPPSLSASGHPKDTPSIEGKGPLVRGPDWLAAPLAAAQGAGCRIHGFSVRDMQLGFARARGHMFVCVFSKDRAPASGQWIRPVSVYVVRVFVLRIFPLWAPPSRNWHHDPVDRPRGSPARSLTSSVGGRVPARGPLSAVGPAEIEMRGGLVCPPLGVEGPPPSFSIRVFGPP